MRRDKKLLTILKSVLPYQYCIHYCNREISIAQLSTLVIYTIEDNIDGHRSN